LKEVRSVIVGSSPEIAIAGTPGRDGLEFSQPYLYEGLSVESDVSQVVG
jgi:hypothetical protein